MVNINFIGRLGRDAEVIKGQKGDFLSFSVATDEYKNGNQTTTWMNVNYNNVRLAEWLKKGKMVLVTGTETVRTYTNKNGETQISRDVNANAIEFVNTSSGQTQDNSSEFATTQTKAVAEVTTGSLVPPTTTTTKAVNPAHVEYEELPF